MTDPLLSYVFSTDPDPLTASQQARINVGLFPGKTAVYCDQIRIAVPVGPTATDGYDPKPVSSVNTGRWLVDDTVRVVSGAAIALNAAITYAVYTFVPRDHTEDQITYPLAFGLLGDISQTPGTFEFVVQERSGTTADRSTYVLRQATFPLDKGTTQLYLRNLVAALQATPTVPATQVSAGAPLRLEWSSSGTWFELYAGAGGQPVYRGPATSATLDAGISRDTTFLLLASAAGDPGSAQPQGDYRTIYAYATLTLAVTDPTLPQLTVTDLAATSITATDAHVSVLSNGGGGSPFIRDDNGHTWLFKWLDQEGTDLVAQFFMWDNNQKWGGLKLPDGGYKTFVVDHPLDPARYLVHATLEGPEAAVFYRGTSQVTAGRVEISLPEYADALTDPDSWTVQLTNIGGFDRLAVETVDDNSVHKGRFVVVSESPDSTQSFHWEAKGTRCDQGALDPEPTKHGLDVYGLGPYTFAVPVSTLAVQAPGHDE